MKRLAQGCPKTWSAKDGVTEPYRDVFTGVFWAALRKLLQTPKQYWQFTETTLVTE